MSKVIVIGTIHSEGGACTAEELLQIIDEISAQTIFVEASKQKLPLMLDSTDSFNTPEIKVLRKLVKRDFRNILPVDLDNDPFDGRLEAMLNLFRRQIKDYYYASKLQSNESYRLGFKYLNGLDCDQINRDKAKMEMTFVTHANHKELSKTYSDWLGWNDDRESYWIESIQEYHDQNEISMSIFIVGAAHRIRLMEKVKSLVHSNYQKIEWEFYHFN